MIDDLYDKERERDELKSRRLSNTERRSVSRIAFCDYAATSNCRHYVLQCNLPYRGVPQGSSFCRWLSCGGRARSPILQFIIERDAVDNLIFVSLSPALPAGLDQQRRRRRTAIINGARVIATRPTAAAAAAPTRLG